MREQPSEVLASFTRDMLEARELGLSFDGAWRRATRARIWCGGSPVHWRVALEQTREEWKSAYLNEPSPVAASLDALQRALVEVDQVPISELDSRRRSVAA